jgi:hypothetical protein
MTKDQQTFRRTILAHQAIIDASKYAIDEVAMVVIDDFHFLDYKVSTVYTCEDSPIGMCVWALEEGQFNLNCRCRYCNNPVERK